MPGLGLKHESHPSYYESKTEIPNTERLIDANGARGDGRLKQESTNALPKVRALPNTASVAEVVEALKITGGVIIRDAVSHEDIDIIES